MDKEETINTKRKGERPRKRWEMGALGDYVSSQKKLKLSLKPQPETAEGGRKKKDKMEVKTCRWPPQGRGAGSLERAAIHTRGGLQSASVRVARSSTKIACHFGGERDPRAKPPPNQKKKHVRQNEKSERKERTHAIKCQNMVSKWPRRDPPSRREKKGSRS